MTTTTVSELDGCTVQNADAVRQAIAAINGIEVCAIYRSARSGFMLFANIAPGLNEQAAHSAINTAIGGLGVVARPAEKVSPVNVSI